MTSQFKIYMKICQIKTFSLNEHYIDQICYKDFANYFQRFHYSGSQETMKPVNLLFVTDFCQRGRDEKDVVNFYRKSASEMTLVRKGS